jgi:hypothetical protein
MANAGTDTNGSQFFITLSDLSGRLPKKYTIFGQVTSGFDVVQKIGDVPVDGSSPKKDVLIDSASVGAVTEYTFQNLADDHTIRVIFTNVTHKISGYVLDMWQGGIQDVPMVGLPGAPLTDSNGYYEASVSPGSSGVVTPQKEGYTFSPESIAFSNVAGDLTNINYRGYMEGWWIEGYVRTAAGAGISSVVMSGLQGNPKTDSKGYYARVVPYGWVGTVAPLKTGYTFSPVFRSYSDVSLNQSAQNYVGAPSITISGYVRLSNGAGIFGVVMSGLPDKPATDPTGYYECAVPSGWSGTVTPQKAGFAFIPINRAYSNVTSKKTNQNYTGVGASFTISGYVRLTNGAPLSSVKMQGLPGTPSTNSSGYYASTVPAGWSGVVTPVKSGYLFTPSYRSYGSVASQLANQNYTATRGCMISGYARTSSSVGIAGVTMTGLPGSPGTNTHGYYVGTVPYGWSGKVTPQKTGYALTPAFRTYSIVKSDKSNQNYTGAGP